MELTIVLLDPEIPQNTGSIGRLCAGLNIPLIIVGNPPFDLDEKAARRAGLDYWPYLTLRQYPNFRIFQKEEMPKNFYLFSKKAKKNLFDQVFPKKCHLLFGCESKGLPVEILEKFPDQTLRIPILNESVRSLNLANAVSVAAYSVVSQFHKFHQIQNQELGL